MANIGFSEGGKGSAERGPGSFALQVPGAPQQRASEIIQDAPKVGIEGGAVTSTGRIAAPSRNAPIQSIGQLPEVKMPRDPTADLLFKLGGIKAQEAVAKRERELFVQGATRAAAGEAMVNIANEQPWMSRVFGDTALVEGARAYSVKAGVAQWAGEQLNSMKELRKQSPDAAAPAISATIGRFMTGDPGTDAAIQEEFLAQVPSIVKEHTKQHYLYLQETAKTARDNAFAAVFNKSEAYHQNVIDGTDADQAAETASVALALMPAPGVDQAAHWAAVVEQAVSSLGSGNVSTYTLLKRTGMLTALPLDAQTTIDIAIRKAAPAALQGAAKVLFNDLVELNKFKGNYTEDQLKAEYARINTTAASVSGIPEDIAQLIGTNSQLTGLSQLDAFNNAKRNAAQTKVTAAVQGAIIASLLAGPPSKGSLEDLKRDGVTAKQIEDGMSDRLMALPPTERGMWLADWGASHVHSDRGEALVADAFAKLSQPNPVVSEAQALLDMWRGFKQSPARMAYFKGGMDKYMAALDSVESSSKSLAVALTTTRFDAQNVSTVTLTAPLREAIDATVLDRYTKGTFMGTFAAIGRVMDPLASQTPNASATDLAQLRGLAAGYAMNNPTAYATEAGTANASVQSVMNTGAASWAGERLILNTDVPDARASTLTTILGSGNEDENGIILSYVIAEKSRLNGVVTGTSRVFRMKGTKGSPLMYEIHGVDAEGNDKYAYVRLGDMVAARKRIDVAKAAAAASARTQDQATIRATGAAASAVFTQVPSGVGGRPER